MGEPPTNRRSPLIFVRQCGIVIIVKLVSANIYERRVKAILAPIEQTAVENDIVNNPKNFPVIPGTGGIRKAKAVRGNRGKSGGARVIFYFWQMEDTIFLLAAYAKSEKEDVTIDEQRHLKALVEELKRIGKEKNNV